jgi:hypothetical protein
VQEVNSDYFGIERSSNGKSWKEVGRVPAQANGSVVVRYDYEDESPMKGIGYYRLKMVDQDDSYSYSDIVSVRYGDVQPLAYLYPNPVSNELFIESRLLVRVESLQITDLQGRLVLNESWTDATAVPSKKQSINVRSWNEGIYLVTILNRDGSRKQERLVIRH